MNGQFEDVAHAASELQVNRMMSTPEEVKRFVDAVAYLARARTEDALRALLQGFDEASEHQEVMEKLILAVESYPAAQYAPQLLAELPALALRAPHHVEDLHRRLLRSPPLVAAYRASFRYAEPRALEGAVAVLSVLAEDGDDDEPDVLRAREMLAELSGGPG